MVRSEAPSRLRRTASLAVIAFAATACNEELADPVPPTGPVTQSELPGTYLAEELRLIEGSDTIRVTETGGSATLTLQGAQAGAVIRRPGQPDAMMTGAIWTYNPINRQLRLTGGTLPLGDANYRASRDGFAIILEGSRATGDLTSEPGFEGVFRKNN